MSRLLRTTSGDALVTASGALSGVLPVFPAQSTGLEFGISVSDAIEGVENRLYPISNNRVVSVTLGGTEYFMDWEVGSMDIQFTHNTVDYTLTVGQWGFCTLSYDPADVASLPADDTTGTVIATITAYKVASLTSDILGATYTSTNIVLNGYDTSGAVDVTPPAPVSITPTGTGAALNATVLITCTENVYIGAGNFYIYDVTAGAVLQTIPVASANYVGTQIQLTTSGQSNSNQYSVRWDAGAFEDLAGNPVAVLSTNTYSWTTQAASTLSAMSPDTTVSSLATLYSTLASWQSNWNGTIPSGKTSSDFRVIGINANTTGTFTLNGYTFPQNVYIRHVGTFNNDSTCSVSHTGIGVFTNNTKLHLWRMYLKTPDTAAYSNGVWSVNGNTDCSIEKCAAEGWPFVPIGTNWGTTANFFQNNGGNTRFTFKHIVYSYMSDGMIRNFGQSTNLVFEGNLGRWIGGDDYSVNANADLIDVVWRANCYARRRAKQAGNHNDCIQFNKSGTAGPGAKATRYLIEYDVAYRGVWTGAISNPGETGWAAYFLDNSSNPSTGPHLAQHNLILCGHYRGLTPIAGSGQTAQFITCVQHDNDQPPNAGIPMIYGNSTASRNLVASNTTFVQTSKFTTGNQEGTGGLDLLIGGANDGTGANFSLLLPYFTAIPTNYTDLWDIRPPIGAITHPDYTPSANRIGCFDLWAKLFDADPLVCHSRNGWPIDSAWIADYDYNDNFWGSYTGNYDSNGDSV